MKKVIIIALIALLSGCVTQRRCYEKFPPVIINRDTVFFRDTVYFFSVTTDTVYSAAHITDTVTASTGIAGGSAWVSRDTIRLKVWQKDTVVVFKDSIRTEIKEVTRIIEQPCRKTPVLNKLIAIGAILIILVFIIKIKY